MKKMVLFALIGGFALSCAGAQSLTPTAGDFGVGASVSSSTGTIDVFYYPTSSLVVEPQVGFGHSNNNLIAGGASASFPDTWWYVGIGSYYVLKDFPRMSVQAGPVIQYESEHYTDSYTSDYIQLTSWSLEIALRLVGMVAENLGIYTSLGGFYSLTDMNDITAGSEQTLSSYGVESLSLGVAYYFK